MKSMPISFRCTKERQEHDEYPARTHDVERTGRTRPARGRYNLGKLETEQEYKCSCGHTGWSAHPDVLFRPVAQ